MRKLRIKKNPKGQLGIFDERADDLPLFSGTPVKVAPSLYRPKRIIKQLSLMPEPRRAWYELE